MSNRRILTGNGMMTLCMGVVTIGFLGYIAFAEQQARANRAAPPEFEYKVPLYAVSLVGAETKGARTARVVVVVHSDFICPACRKFALQRLPALDQRYISAGKVLLAMRHAPVGRLHSLANRAAEAAFCAGRQGRFWEMHDLIFKAQLDREYGRLEVDILDHDLPEFASALSLDAGLFKQCLSSDDAAQRVFIDAGAALALGVESTPSIMLGVLDSDGRVVVKRHFRGLPPEEELNTAIDAELRALTPSHR